jgi:Na+/melibiose symporter-like transporter
LWRLGAIYVPVILGLFLTVITIISFYKIDRTKHEEALRELASRKTS